MPFTSGYSRYRYGVRRYGRRRFGRSFGRRYAGGQRSSLAALRRQVRSLQVHARAVGWPEKKYADTQVDDTLSAGGDTYIVDIIGSSSLTNTVGPSGMIGDKIVIKSIQLNGRAILVPSGGPPVAINDGSNNLRIMLYEDTAPVLGVIPAPGDLLLPDPSSGNLGTSSLRNMDNSNRFFVFWDQKYSFSSTGVQAVSWDKFFKIDRTVELQFPSNVPAGVNRTFGVLVVTDAGANVVGLDCNARIRYTDN